MSKIVFAEIVASFPCPKNLSSFQFIQIFMSNIMKSSYYNQGNTKYTQQTIASMAIIVSEWITRYWTVNG